MQMNKLPDKLHIGVVSPANPSAFVQYIDNIKLPEMYTNTTAVSTYVIELLRHGHTVSIFTDTYDDDMVKDFHSEQLHIYIVPRDIRRNGLRTFSPLTFSYKLRRFISKYINNIDVLHAQWTYEYALAAKHFAKRMPVFCTVRDWCPYILSLQDDWKLKIRWMIYQHIFRKVMDSKDMHFIANSEYTLSRIKNEYPEKCIEVIYNPIDKDIILNEKKKDIRKPVFITICHIVSDSRKNIITLLRAFSLFKEKYSDAKLLVVGECNDDCSVYSQAFHEGLTEGVNFLGRIPHSELISVIDDATCLVHPSFEETFGNILLEGMSRCIPCIGGKNSGAVPQVLDYGRCGILCDIYDAEDLCHAMELLQDKEYAERIVKNASLRIQESFTSDITMRQTIRLYNNYSLPNL